MPLSQTERDNILKSNRTTVSSVPLKINTSFEPLRYPNFTIEQQLLYRKLTEIERKLEEIKTELRKRK
jgi:hypothetical protein